MLCHAQLPQGVAQRDHVLLVVSLCWHEHNTMLSSRGGSDQLQLPRRHCPVTVTNPDRPCSDIECSAAYDRMMLPHHQVPPSSTLRLENEKQQPRAWLVAGGNSEQKHQKNFPGWIGWGVKSKMPI
jgi:hypothetical protein